MLSATQDMSAMWDVSYSEVSLFYQKSIEIKIKIWRQQKQIIDM